MNEYPSRTQQHQHTASEEETTLQFSILYPQKWPPRSSLSLFYRHWPSMPLHFPLVQASSNASLEMAKVALDKAQDKILTQITLDRVQDKALTQIIRDKAQVKTLTQALEPVLDLDSEVDLEAKEILVAL
jgi:hypothetical protein